MRTAVGSSKPPIMRTVVVLPQPDGLRRAKKLPRAISSERLSTATTSSKRFVTSTRRTSAGLERGGAAGSVRSSTAIAAGLPGHVGTPVVELLPELEVEEALRRHDAVERAHPVRQLEQLAPVGADELDEDVELAGRDHDVARLVPLRDLVGDRLRRAGGADADHRHGVEAEPERVRHARDLEDVVL